MVKNEESKVEYIRLVCERCEEGTGSIRLVATDQQGNVLDVQNACPDCTKEAGFQIGKQAEEKKA